MASTKPRRIRGSWADGYALDLHSTGATFLGHNEFGHPEFQTHRTEMGELLYRLKYKGDEAALAEIAEAAEAFLRSWKVELSIIVPVPPSTNRRIQPVFRVAEEIGARFHVPVLKASVRKRKAIPALKDIYDFDERRRLLADAFAVNQSEIESHRILLVDDLYRSGATLNAVTDVLMSAGASVVYALALTQTRKNV
jgi:predicted amidophosphoribosyltransferase